MDVRRLAWMWHDFSGLVPARRRRRKEEEEGGGRRKEEEEEAWMRRVVRQGGQEEWCRGITPRGAAGGARQDEGRGGGQGACCEAEGGPRGVKDFRALAMISTHPHSSPRLFDAPEGR
ncbi:unnamed protein product [Prorocentrum cordatum]|uniref:Uncharacterized protein n=1 Tax=Prorocentrum cordatum TaxID=2364126 RepID=A0ABN9SM91_9DINO|nr:unnamed protein product [Polarella glacialis]